MRLSDAPGIVGRGELREVPIQVRDERYASAAFVDRRCVPQPGAAVSGARGNCRSARARRRQQLACIVAERGRAPRSLGRAQRGRRDSSCRAPRSARAASLGRRAGRRTGSGQPRVRNHGEHRRSRRELPTRWFDNAARHGLRTWQTWCGRSRASRCRACPRTRVKCRPIRIEAGDQRRRRDRHGRHAEADDRSRGSAAAARRAVPRRRQRCWPVAAALKIVCARRAERDDPASQVGPRPRGSGMPGEPG